MPSFDNPYDLPALERGVYRDTAALLGYVRWRVIDREGVLIREEMVLASKFEGEADLLDAERSLRSWLERVDKRQHLRAI